MGARALSIGVVMGLAVGPAAHCAWRGGSARMSSLSHRPNAEIAALRKRGSAVLAALGDGLVDVSAVLANSFRGH